MRTYNHFYLLQIVLGVLFLFIIILSRDIKIGGPISSSISTELKDIQSSPIVDFKQTTNSNEEEEKQIKNQKINLI